jgi:hypothetical protein
MVQGAGWPSEELFLHIITQLHRSQTMQIDRNGALRRTRLSATVLAVAALAACSDAMSPEPGSLTSEEARELAFQMADSHASGLGVGNVFSEGASSSISATDGASLSVASAAAADTFSTTFDRTVSCRQGGTNRVVGQSSGSSDRTTGAFSRRYQATSTPNQCAFVVDSASRFSSVAGAGATITINGAPTIVVTSTASGTRPVRSSSGTTTGTHTGTYTSTQKGSFTYTTSNNRSGTCNVDVTTRVDFAARTYTTTGTFCGQAINESGELGRGRGKHGRGDGLFGGFGGFSDLGGGHGGHHGGRR